MSWITPIYDRTLTDVQTKTAKGLFNVADWNRIYGNAQYVNAELITNAGSAIPFSTLTTPTMTYIPQVSDFNSLLGNIEAMRVKTVSFGATIAAITTLTWIAGPGNSAPNYVDVNQWEYCINQIKIFLDLLSISDIICGVATTGGDFVIDAV